ncbi:MAG TPA: cyclopropane-fatty-acyl-phospholipid synthase family protein [Candidatus Binatia bacterium]|nr:cyclopropane-fatty-acyl-phospholipid synthase family protein [Candidatus Binatia bacterium]
MPRSQTAGAQPATREPPLPAGLRLLAWALKGLRIGSLEVRFPDGRVREFRGREPGPHGVLHMRDAAMMRRVARHGDVGFAEAYLDGQWDSPDPATALQALFLNEQHYLKLFRVGALTRRWHQWMHAARANTRRQARRNIEYHYDLGNDFYRLWLDDTLTYSSAVFAQPGQSLRDAQLHKYALMLERLQLEPQHHLLEIGSGWGGFALYAARQTGCRVTSLTLSQEQLKEARARAEAAGLADRVQFELRDYRDERGTYDRVVSIEMYEAVGEEFWPDWFAAIERALVPGGRAAIQGITIDAARFAGYRRGMDFIQKYIFPGGMLAPAALFQDLARNAGLASEAPAFFGTHYADTLAAWHRNVLAARDAITAMHDERFLRMWRYYLAYCECGFRTGSIDLMQVTLRKQGRPC